MELCLKFYDGNLESFEAATCFVQFFSVRTTLSPELRNHIYIYIYIYIYIWFRSSGDRVVLIELFSLIHGELGSDTRSKICS